MLYGTKTLIKSTALNAVYARAKEILKTDVSSQLSSSNYSGLLLKTALHTFLRRILSLLVS